MSEIASPSNLKQTLELLTEPSADEHISLSHMVNIMGTRSYGPLLLGPSLLVFLPTGAIPGLPLIMAILIILIAFQMVIGRESMWLPNFVARFAIKRERIRNASQRFQWLINFMDKLFKPRQSYLVKGPMKILVAIQCLIYALMMIIFEVVPFLVIGPACGMMLISLGLTARDGLMIGLSQMIFILGLGGLVTLGVVYFS